MCTFCIRYKDLRDPGLCCHCESKTLAIIAYHCESNLCTRQFLLIPWFDQGHASLGSNKIKPRYPRVKHVFLQRSGCFRLRHRKSWWSSPSMAALDKVHPRCRGAPWSNPSSMGTPLRGECSVVPKKNLQNLLFLACKWRENYEKPWNLPTFGPSSLDVYRSSSLKMGGSSTWRHFRHPFILCAPRKRVIILILV